MSASSFIEAQGRVLDRYGVVAEERDVDVSVIRGRAHVLVVGEGPPVVMANGIGTPAAMWAPLMAELGGVTIHAVDLPGYGLTDVTSDITVDFRSKAVRFRQVFVWVGFPRRFDSCIQILPLKRAK